MDTRKYASIESTTCFNFTNLVAKTKESLVKEYPGLKGKSLEDLIYKNLVTFNLNEQEFDYVSHPNNFCGVRWYVKYPRCSDPCLKLYLPNMHKDREQLYLCKNCHKLKNASLLMGHSKKYTKVVKPLKQLEKIRSQLLKKDMTPDKAKPLLDEYKKIEQELAASAEYRLMRFQKEHGMPVL